MVLEWLCVEATTMEERGGLERVVVGRRCFPSAIDDFERSSPDDSDRYLFSRSGQPVAFARLDRSALVAGGDLLGSHLARRLFRHFPGIRFRTIWLVFAGLGLLAAVLVQPSVTFLAVQSAVFGVRGDPFGTGDRGPDRTIEITVDAAAPEDCRAEPGGRGFVLEPSTQRRIRRSDGDPRSRSIHAGLCARADRRAPVESKARSSTVDGALIGDLDAAGVIHCSAGSPTPPECPTVGLPRVVGPVFKGRCGPRAHSEGRRPAVGHSCGVRDPRQDKRRKHAARLSQEAVPLFGAGLMTPPSPRPKVSTSAPYHSSGLSITSFATLPSESQYEADENRQCSGRVTRPLRQGLSCR